MATHTCPSHPCPICAEPLLSELRRSLEAAEHRALSAETALAVEREEAATTIAELKSQIADARSPCCLAAVRCGRCGGDTRYSV